MTIEELRAAMNAARQKMADVHEEIERALDLPEDTPADDRPDTAELEKRFESAEKEWKKAQERFERASRIPQPVEAPKSAPIESAISARSADVSVGREESTYRPDQGASFFRDMFAQQSDAAAQARLHRHLQETRDLNSTDANGGHLVAPLYLQNEFIDLARAGRVVTNAIGVRPLAPNTDSIVIPKMATGVAVDDQTGDADNGAVVETDATFSEVTAAVKTVAGMQDVSQQLLDRSVPGIDRIIYADLLKAYNVRLDTKVLTSTATNSEGLLAADNANAVTYTATTPTAAGLYSKIADAIQQIHTDVFMPADAIFMHPRRWAFLLAASDSAGRPLVLPAAQMPDNALAAFGGVVPEGLVGQLQGLPVFVDPNIPTNLGSGTNEDRVIVIHRPDHFIWEDPTPRLETFRDVGSGTLTVRFRLFNYFAQQHERRDGSLSVIAGSGLATPSF